MNNEKIKCENCKFFCDGCCRRNAPVVFEKDHETCFPVVGKNDWCGQFKARNATIERKLGERFQDLGETLEVVFADEWSCLKCFYKKAKVNCFDRRHVRGSCNNIGHFCRTDNNCVVFQRVEDDK